MKYIYIVPDGAADYPMETLGGKTPMEIAEIPAMDSLSAQGVIGRVKTVPKGFIPSSDVANLSLLGYEPQKFYTGRGPLEAANLGVTLGPDDLAFRCNFITAAEGKLLDYSAGHITENEAQLLLKALQEQLGNDRFEFFPGKSYRHLLVVRGGVSLGLDTFTYKAPHDIMGESIEKNLPKGEAAKCLVDLMHLSQGVLSAHEINKVRIDLTESPANMIWLWGCGKTPVMPSFKERFGLEGAVISAVDLIKGMGRIMGLRVIEVEGATGYYDTNYQGKAQAALDVLRELDFVFIHIEATDEAGHNQDLRMKIKCLERIDRFVVAPFMEQFKDQPHRILISPDHPTPVSKRTHTDEPVPFVVAGTGIEPDAAGVYSEPEAGNSSLYFEHGVDLMRYFLGK